MSEQISPDLYLNMKREWFAKILNGEKMVKSQRALEKAGGAECSGKPKSK